MDAEAVIEATLRAEARRQKDVAIIAERLRDERVLIFRNLLNGLPVWRVVRDFRKNSEQEVMDVFRHVLRKIRSRCIELDLPQIVGSSISEVQRSKMQCFRILPRINLDKERRYADVKHEGIEMKKDGTVRNTELIRALKPLPPKPIAPEGRP